MELRRLVYASKPFMSSPLGRPINHMGKIAAGLYFDIFLQRYHTEGMTFDIPKEHTTLAMRGKFTADTYELPERILIKRPQRRYSNSAEALASCHALSTVSSRNRDITSLSKATRMLSTS